MADRGGGCCNYAKTLPGVDASRVGLLGFSLGGHICLRLRAMAKVLVEFFAPEGAEWGGLGSTTSRTLHAQIHHGLADNLVRYVPNAVNIEKILKGEGAVVELCSYEGAGHGFAGDDPANAKARKDAMDGTLSFFIKHL
ncbi:MAG: dienelactone hydrolase family protein [Chromatiales bacterium]